MRALAVVVVALASRALAADSAPASSAASAPAVLSLDLAVQTARAQQPQLRQAQAAVAAAQAHADVALAPLLPQVAGSLGYQRSTGNTALRPGQVYQAQTNKSPFDTFDYFNGALGVDQLVWDFGQTWNRWDAAKATAHAQQATAASTLLLTELNVRTAFFNARAAKALLQVATESLANQQRHLDQIQGFVDLGRRPEIDLAQVRTDRANARVQRVNAENGYATARARLNQAMGVEGSTDYDVSDELMPVVAGEDESLAPLLDEALRARPDLSAQQRQIEAQQLSAKAIGGGYWPRLGVATNVSDAGTAIDKLAWNWNAGVTLTWPLFQGGLTMAQSREAKANVDSLQAQLDTLRQQVRLEVEQARLGVRAARSALEAAAEAVDNAQQRLRLAEGRYETGVGNAIELSDAQLALSNALAQKIQADYNLAIARAQLVKALGRQ